MRRNSDPDTVFLFDPNGFEKLRAKFEPLGPDERGDRCRHHGSDTLTG